jgi:aminoglycoside phosphotransferase (APT) family kinase protein
MSTSAVIDFPSRPEDVHPGWLDSQLRRVGLLRDGRVAGLRWERFGVGQVGDSIRFWVSYDRDGAGPASVVGKFPSTDATSRQTAANLGLYTKETKFYREIRALLDVRAPDCYVAEVNDTGTQFILLFEDLGPARVGDQLAGCSVGDARAAMRQAAAMHAPSWNLPAVIAAGWMHRSPDFLAQIEAAYPKAHEVFRERYEGVLAPELLRVCDDMRDMGSVFLKRVTPDNCFVHGDFRLDNMLFDIKGGAEPIAILDYQAPFVGSGLIDVGYFLGCGIGSGLRRPHERELLELYCEEMSRRGVRLSVKDIWDDYRIGACHGLMVAVFSAAFVMRTERGDQSYLSMARGAAELLLDHDSIGALRSWAEA